MIFITDSQLISIITQTVNSSIRDVFSSKKSSYWTKKSAYEKTEQLLYNYTKVKELIHSKIEQLEELKKHGIRYESKSIMEYQDYGEKVYGLESREESTQLAIKSVTENLIWLNKIIYKVDSALSDIMDDEHYSIIPRYYFDGESRNDIAKSYGVDLSTISRWRKQLVAKLSISLFPNESLSELME